METSSRISCFPTRIVSLNRGHWCSYCRIELEGLQAIHAEVAAREASIVAITPDRQVYAQKLKARSGLAFPVLSDASNGFAMSLGLVVWVGDEIRDLYSAGGTDLSEYQNDQGWLIPIPATYVVTADRRIKASFVDPDFRRRMEPADVLDALA
jgi:peroxiredoxin